MPRNIFLIKTAQVLYLPTNPHLLQHKPNVINLNHIRVPTLAEWNNPQHVTVRPRRHRRRNGRPRSNHNTVIAIRKQLQKPQSIAGTLKIDL